MKRLKLLCVPFALCTHVLFWELPYLVGCNCSKYLEGPDLGLPFAFQEESAGIVS